jgi:predicted metal-dependent peptidase
VSSDRDDPFTVIEQAANRQMAEEQVSRALGTARAKLILGRDAKSAFFATLALRLKPESAWDIDTLATDGHVLQYHPPFVTGLSPDELVGVLAHEVMHNALAHPARRGDGDSE